MRAANVYNHCIALHKRYYRIFGKHLNKNKLMKHIAKLRNKNEYWQLVGSQAVQDIIQRIDRAYQLFFKHHFRDRGVGCRVWGIGGSLQESVIFPEFHLKEPYTRHPTPHTLFTNSGKVAKYKET